MNDAGQILTLLLAVAGAATSAVALWVNRSNAQDARAASDAATVAKAEQDKQSLAHQELIDALEQMGNMVDRYRAQVDETRMEMARLTALHEQQQARNVEIVEEHRKCQKEYVTLQADLAAIQSSLRAAEARITELGG